MAENRVYRTVYNSNWRNKIPQILMSGNPVCFVKIDTTGLDPLNSELIGIVIAKGHFEDDEVIFDDSYASLIKPVNPIDPEVTSYNGITNEAVADAPSLKQVMHEACTFIGKDANIIGLQTQDFLGPFLCKAAADCNEELSVAYTLDILHMAQAMLEPKKGFKYRYIDIITRLGINPESGIVGYISLFNELYKRIPTGTVQATLSSVTPKEFSYTSSWLYVNTDCGSVRLNRSNCYWEETVPGFFDLVDMEKLTQTILEHYKVPDIRAFAHLQIFQSKYFY